MSGTLHMISHLNLKTTLRERYYQSSVFKCVKWNSEDKLPRITESRNNEVIIGIHIYLTPKSPPSFSIAILLIILIITFYASLKTLAFRPE